MRQLDLAVEIGKSSNYINSIENGKYFPSPETIEQIAAFLSIEPMLLFDRAVPPADGRPPLRTEELQTLEQRLQETIAHNIADIFSELK